MGNKEMQAEILKNQIVIMKALASMTTILYNSMVAELTDRIKETKKLITL